jgi:hypothetical protein
VKLGIIDSVKLFQVDRLPQKREFPVNEILEKFITGCQPNETLLVISIHKIDKNLQNYSRNDRKPAGISDDDGCICGSGSWGRLFIVALLDRFCASFVFRTHCRSLSFSISTSYAPKRLYKDSKRSILKTPWKSPCLCSPILFFCRRGVAGVKTSLSDARRARCEASSGPPHHGKIFFLKKTKGFSSTSPHHNLPYSITTTVHAIHVLPDVYNTFITSNCWSLGSKGILL